MINSKALYQQVVNGITLSEDVDEIKSIACLIMENVFDVSRTDLVAGKTISPDPESLEQLEEYIGRVNKGEPVQYILGEAYFFGRIFRVGPSVLIPRPETELLLRTVLLKKNFSGSARHKKMRLLDIGTGSGCIAIALALEWPEAEVFATDISSDALALAKENAGAHQVSVSFLDHDILNDDIPLHNIDIIVSNPPYVTRSEVREMKRNVLAFEPHSALFVSDDDPLIYYKALVNRSKSTLAERGMLAVEINERFGGQVELLFKDEGFIGVEVIKDLDGKSRVVSGVIERD